VEEIAKRQGAAGLIRLLADIAVRVPLEYLSEMRSDMRYASRALIKSPGFALVGIISMGLAIGLTTNVYGSKWQLVFQDLPAAANAKELVMPQNPVSYYYVEQYRKQKSLLAGVAAFQNGVPFNVIVCLVTEGVSSIGTSFDGSAGLGVAAGVLVAEKVAEPNGPSEMSNHGSTSRKIASTAGSSRVVPAGSPLSASGSGQRLIAGVSASRRADRSPPQRIKGRRRPSQPAQTRSDHAPMTGETIAPSNDLLLPSRPSSSGTSTSTRRWAPKPSRG